MSVTTLSFRPLYVSYCVRLDSSSDPSSISMEVNYDGLTPIIGPTGKSLTAKSWVVGIKELSGTAEIEQYSGSAKIFAGEIVSVSLKLPKATFQTLLNGVLSNKRLDLVYIITLDLIEVGQNLQWPNQPDTEISIQCIDLYFTSRT